MFAYCPCGSADLQRWGKMATIWLHKSPSSELNGWDTTSLGRQVTHQP